MENNIQTKQSIQTFKVENYHSIEEVYEMKKNIWNNLTREDLVIFDLDGVLIMWPFSIHTFLFRFSKRKILAFENIMKKSSAWIFTDRPMIIFKPLEKRLFSSMINNTNISLENLLVWNNKDDLFPNISIHSPTRAVIYNASKGTVHAEEIILKANENFNRIYYLASQDIHSHYQDLDLLKRVEEKHKVNLSKITFIDIKKKWFQR